MRASGEREPGPSSRPGTAEPNVRTTLSNAGPGLSLHVSPTRAASYDDGGGRSTCERPQHPLGAPFFSPAVCVKTWTSERRRSRPRKQGCAIVRGTSAGGWDGSPTGGASRGRRARAAGRDRPPSGPSRGRRGRARGRGAGGRGGGGWGGGWVSPARGGGGPPRRGAGGGEAGC